MQGRPYSALPARAGRKMPPLKEGSGAKRQEEFWAAPTMFPLPAAGGLSMKRHILAKQKEGFFMKLSEKTLSSEQIFDGRLLKVYCDQVELSDGDTSVREYVHHPGGAAVVALDGEGNVYLERQFRYPYRKVVTEIPAGKLEPGEDPFFAIQRELKEEIGAVAGKWDALGHIMPSVGYTDEMLYLFLARDLTFGSTHMDEDEFLVPFRLPFAEALAQAAEGKINDAKTVAALFRADRLLRAEKLLQEEHDG